MNVQILFFIFSTYEGLISLRLEPGVREVGMGGVGVSSAQGPAAVYFNPARLSSTGLSISHTQWILDLHHSSAFLAQPLGEWRVGVGLRNFSYGSVELRDSIPSPEPIAHFTPQDFTGFLSLSRVLDPHTRVGISGRVYYEKIYRHQDWGIGADFGLLYELKEGVGLGFALCDFATPMRLGKEEFRLPTRTRLGGSWGWSLGRVGLELASDLEYYFYSQDLRLGVGGEARLQGIELRAGYRLLRPSWGEYRLLSTGGLRAGVGFRVGRLRLDYGYQPFELDLGAAHHLSLRIDG